MADEILDTVGKKEAKEAIWKAFLSAYSELGHFGKACEAIGVSHATVRRALKNVPEFNDLYKEARQILADRLEDALAKRAIDGVRRLKFTKDGSPCVDPKTGEAYEETQFSDVAAIFRLKELRPEYRERYEHTGPGGGPIQAQVTNLADLIRLATGAEPAKGKGNEVTTKAENLAK